MMRDYFAGEGTASEVANKYRVAPSRVYNYAKRLEKMGMSRAHVKKSPTKTGWDNIARSVKSYVEKKSTSKRSR